MAQTNAPAAQTQRNFLKQSSVRSVLAPTMIHELFPSLTETASGSHPCCIVSVTYGQTLYFHGANEGSNPSGDANKFNNFHVI